MQRVVIQSGIAPLWRRLLSTSATDTSFPAISVSSTDPAILSNAVRVGADVSCAKTLALIPFGAGADNATFDIRAIGWRRTADIWIPATLAAVTCTLSTLVGSSGATLVATDRIADTLAAISGPTGLQATLVSPANNTAAQILIDTLGYEIITIDFDLGTATGANALYAAF